MSQSWKLLITFALYLNKLMGKMHLDPLNFGSVSLRPSIFFLANLVPKLQRCAK